MHSPDTAFCLTRNSVHQSNPWLLWWHHLDHLSGTLHGQITQRSRFGKATLYLWEKHWWLKSWTIIWQHFFSSKRRADLVAMIHTESMIVYPTSIFIGLLGAHWKLLLMIYKLGDSFHLHSEPCKRQCTINYVKAQFSWNLTSASIKNSVKIVWKWALGEKSTFSCPRVSLKAQIWPFHAMKKWPTKHLRPMEQLLYQTQTSPLDLVDTQLMWIPSTQYWSNIWE